MQYTCACICTGHCVFTYFSHKSHFLLISYQGSLEISKIGNSCGRIWYSIFGSRVSEVSVQRMGWLLWLVLRLYSVPQVFLLFSSLSREGSACPCLSSRFTEKRGPAFTVHWISGLLVTWWWCVSRSVVSDSATPRTVAHQAPLSVDVSRQEYWSE